MERRQGQEAMLERLAAAVELSADRCLPPRISVAEAPTGTGKSYVILLLALAAREHYGWRTILSSQTKVLQDQFVAKDIPAIKRQLVEVADTAKWKTGVLKGRNNYICLRRLKRLSSMVAARDVLYRSSAGPFLVNKAVLQPLETIAFRTSADLDRLPISEDSPLLEIVSGRASTCAGKDCPFYAKKCPYYRAMRRDAALIVTNHALLTRLVRNIDPSRLDEAAEEGDEGDETPKRTVYVPPVLDGALYIYDEAHHLMGYATGGTLASLSIPDICASLRAPAPVFVRRGDPAEPVVAHLDAVREKMESWWRGFADLLGEQPESVLFRAPMTERMLKGAELLREWSRINDALEKMQGPVAGSVASWSKEDAGLARRRLVEASQLLDAAAGESGRLVATPDLISVINDTPRSLGDDSCRGLKKLRFMGFVSGTLLVDNKPDVFCAEVGIRPTELPIRVPSPFSFSNMRVWVPKAMPDPTTLPGEYENHALRFCEKYVPPYVRANLGGVLILCSSLARMRKIAWGLRTILLPEGRKVLEQGIMPRGDLVRSFLTSPSSVLVASASFREGFDAVKKRLTWVIIDRLPFACPEDSVFSGRIDQLQRWGLIRGAFDHSLDLMKFDLIQSVGRLIRTQQDWGTVTLLDPRAWTSGIQWGIDRYLVKSPAEWYGGLPSESEWVEMSRSLEEGARPATPATSTSAR
jgi:ATP-dependent DNA helicase DinG